ncbi:MAG: hypothetical protein J5671_08570 [Bacteroidaceae bacterium]|nr:hypothetical protein [Bacteroidaceae bacterium]
MKKKPFLWMLLAVLLCQAPASAQVKKTTVTRPSTARTTAPRTTTPKQTTPTEKRWGCYEIAASYISPTDSVIYYLEGEENNALMSLDCQTGAVKTVIPGIKGVYEGARPLFRDVVATGGKLLLRVTKESKKGIYVWDGKSLSTSKKLGNALEIVSYNGKYVLVYREVPEEPGSSWTKDFYTLWDVEQMKVITNFPVDKGYGVLSDAQLDSLGNAWCTVNEGTGLWCIRPKEASKFYKLFNEPYFMDLKEEGNFNVSDAAVKYSGVTVVGDYVYVASLRRIFRMNIHQPGTWEEYAKMPATQPGTFCQVAALPDGSLLTNSKVNYDYMVHYFPVGQFDTPVSLGKRPSLPTTGHFINMDQECWINLNYMDYDHQGNIIVLTNSSNRRSNNMFNTGSLWVINPQGVKGYKNAVGRIVEH